MLAFNGQSLIEVERLRNLQVDSLHSGVFEGWIGNNRYQQNSTSLCCPSASGKVGALGF